MEPFHFAISVFLLVWCFEHVQNIDSSLSPFGEKVMELLPEDTYNKVFAVNIDSDDQLLKAVQLATDRFNEIIGTKIDSSLGEELYNEDVRLGKSGVSSSLHFHVYTNALSKTLEDEGVLTPDNVGKLAQKYVDELNKSAMALKDYNILSTFPSLVAATARVLKSEGLTSKRDVNQFAKNLVHQLDQH